MWSPRGPKTVAMGQTHDDEVPIKAVLMDLACYRKRVSGLIEAASLANWHTDGCDPSRRILARLDTLRRSACLSEDWAQNVGRHLEG